MYAVMLGWGHYYIEGVGYATVQDVLSGAELPVSLLVILCGLKLLATALTLGSGASGGVFSPGLYMGATLGAAYGTLMNALFPGLGGGVPALPSPAWPGSSAGRPGRPWPPS
jgi:CIC family chloride channel protein